MRETSGTGFRSPTSTKLKVDVIQDNQRDKTEIFWTQGGQRHFIDLRMDTSLEGSFINRKLQVYLRMN